MTAATAALRIMLVDDHVVVRMGFRLLLDTTSDLRVVAECGSGEEALARYAEVNPDVLVLDLSMDGMGGLKTLARLIEQWPDARVLVLSAHEDSAHPRRALAAGALGYLTKRSAAAALVKAIRQVAERQIFLEPALERELALAHVKNQGNPVESLTAREFEVYLLLVQGRSVAEIAEALFLSPRTVGAHVYNIKQKLGSSNMVELTMIAIRNGLIIT